MSDGAVSGDSGQGAPSGAVSSTSGMLGGTTNTPVVTTTEQLTPQPQVNTPSVPDWLKGSDEVTIGYVQNKGWSDPKQVLDGYRNLEKLLGADKANNALVIPKSDADPKEWSAVFDRLGRPSGPDGYKVDFPLAGDKTLHEASLAKFHELGLTKVQGETLLGWFNNQINELNQSTESQKQLAFQQEDVALKSEWGQAYTQNLAKAQAAVRGLGLESETIDKLSDALGHKATMTLLQKIGSGMSEDSFVSGNSTNGFGSAMTPGQAKSEIQSLMSDNAFISKYINKDAQAVARMATLHKFAYPEE